MAARNSYPCREDDITAVASIHACIRRQVWDYAGDGYVHRLIQSKTDGKLVEVAPPRADARADASCSRRADTALKSCKRYTSAMCGSLQTSMRMEKCTVWGIFRDYCLVPTLFCP